MNIQTLDAQNLDPVALIKSLKETGFVVLTNHGIDKHLLAATYSKWESYFSQPTDEKMKNLFGERHDGYFPMKSENAKDYSVKDLKEFYHIFRATEAPEATIEHFGRGAKVSPTHELMEALELLGLGVLSVIDKHLENPDTWIKTRSYLSRSAYKSPSTLFRILHYPPVKNEDLSEGAVRAAAHEDINLITLLPAATQPGLQVKDIEGNWHEVECDPGSIIVNAGDMLQEYSKGEFKSTTHRVVNPDGPNVSRYSMPLFIHPDPSTRLSEKYTAGEYLDERLRELGLK